MKNIFLVLLTLFSFVLPTISFANFTVQNQLTVSVTTVSTQQLPSNLSRKYLLIINNGSNSIVVKFGSVQTGTEGVLVPSGGNYEPSSVPADAVFMESASGTNTVTIIEG